MPENLYQAAYQALIDKGVPISAAQRAAQVIASDKVSVERTPEQQKDVTDAWIWMSAKMRLNQ